MSFDYGAEPVSAGKSFKNATVGKHAARLRSVIHLGMFQEEFKGKLKTVAPQVTFIFELKEESDFEEDGTTPLTISKQVALRKGDKATLTTLEGVFLQANDTGFDDWIGRPCELDLSGSKDVGEDGEPKYINIKTISKLHPKLVALLDDLIVKGSGHCKFADLTREAVEELHPIMDVADTLLSPNNSSYPGSKAESIIAEIRKENPTFAVRKQGDAKPEQSGAAQGATPNGSANKPAATPPAALDEDKDF